MVDETPLFAIVHCHPRPCCFPGLRSVACLQKVYGSRDPGQPTASNTAPRHPTTSTCTLHLPRHQTPQHRIIASSLSLVPRVLTLHDSQRDRRLAITPHSNQSFQQTSWNHLPIQLHLASTLAGSQAQTLSFYHRLPWITVVPLGSPRTALWRQLRRRHLVRWNLMLWVPSLTPLRPTKPAFPLRIKPTKPTCRQHEIPQFTTLSHPRVVTLTEDQR